MNSHDRNKGAGLRFVVRCKASWEGPARQGKQVEERWGDASCVPPSCHGLQRGQLTKDVSSSSPMGARRQGHHRNPIFSFRSLKMLCALVSKSKKASFFFYLFGWKRSSWCDSGDGLCDRSSTVLFWRQQSNRWKFMAPDAVQDYFFLFRLAISTWTWLFVIL